MGTQLVNVVIDTVRPQAQAEFWSALLGWPVVGAEPDEVDVRAPEGDAWELDIVFNPVAEAKTVKNRVHLELASRSVEHQAELVGLALRLGARRLDLGQGDVSWVVLADPEGNEFCVLEPHPRYAGSAVAAILVEARDPVALGGFWSTATGWPVEVTNDEVVALRSPSGQWLEFLRSDTEKRGKDRVHLDVAPSLDTDQAAVVTDLIGIGASHADIGQGDVPWVVLSDPEGHVFCVLTPR